MAKSGYLHGGALRAAALDGALRPKIVGLAESLPGPTWCMALIEDGTAEFRGNAQHLEGPVLVWRKWTEGERIVFGAGAQGVYLLLGAATLANAVGHIPEARDLRDIVETDIAMPLAALPGTQGAVSASLRAILRELEAGSVAAQAVVEAHLRLVLIELFRFAATRLGHAEAKSPADHVFTRFSAMVEQRFRERWGVEDYARALGVTRDRLGDICRRVRGESPKHLVDLRTAFEAQLELETTRRSVQDVGLDLGFGSPAQFNRFFKRMTGQPPGTYRQSVQAGAQARASDSARPFDWP